MGKKIIRKFTEPDDGGLDIYRDVWTVIRKGDTEIYRVYLKKEDAEKAAELRTKENRDYSRNVNKQMSDDEFDKYYKDKHTFNAFHIKFEVKSLADAIDDIKSEMYDLGLGNRG
jgi:phosphoglycolate phosphatase-like HAD superfamily hydrolase